ncbi:hypothetical protein AVEN_224741-1 [Araneus ventricosus]|uniref:Uncharacterized protein n=1 Tax=Araneus ventricosus TaxID=182803 RepID=A0A4Y2HWR8_ARAVE|nr:hypothetical protein AVEN_224741-1 [Araneus ventricosus]
MLEQCLHCYESVILLPCDVSLMVGKRYLHRFVSDAKLMTSDISDKFGDKVKVLENTRIMNLSLLGTYMDLENSMCCDAPSESYKYSRRLKRVNLFGVLFAVRVGLLLDAERYC